MFKKNCIQSLQKVPEYECISNDNQKIQTISIQTSRTNIGQRPQSAKYRRCITQKLHRCLGARETEYAVADW